MKTTIRHEIFLSVEMTESQAHDLQYYLQGVQMRDVADVLKRCGRVNEKLVDNTHELLSELYHVIKPPGAGEVAMYDHPNKKYVHRAVTEKDKDIFIGPGAGEKSLTQKEWDNLYPGKYQHPATEE